MIADIVNREQLIESLMAFSLHTGVDWVEVGENPDEDEFTVKFTIVELEDES
jgi:hypothetical protein